MTDKVISASLQFQQLVQAQDLFIANPIPKDAALFVGESCGRKNLLFTDLVKQWKTKAFRNFVAG